MVVHDELQRSRSKAMHGCCPADEGLFLQGEFGFDVVIWKGMYEIEALVVCARSVRRRSFSVCCCPAMKRDFKLLWRRQFLRGF